MSTDAPTLDLRPPQRRTHASPYRLRVAPERARSLRDACPGDPEVAAAVEAYLRAYLDDGWQQAVLDLVDRWQATDVPAGVRMTRDRLEDLRQYAGSAGRWDAYRVVVLALTPHELCWIPAPREVDAAEVCRDAWNRRAARLRTLGIRPLAGAPGAL